VRRRKIRLYAEVVVVVWKERREKGVCLCPEAGEDVTPELGDLWRFHGVTGLCLEGGSGLTGERK